MERHLDDYLEILGVRGGLKGSLLRLTDLLDDGTKTFADLAVAIQDCGKKLVADLLHVLPVLLLLGVFAGEDG